MADGPTFIPLAGAPLLPTPRAPGPLATNTTHAPEDEIHRTAREFESVFLTEMLKPMFDGLDTNGLGGGGMGEEMFRPMLIQHYAEALSKSGGAGIADSLVRELMRMQANAETVAPAAPSTEAADGVDR